MYTVHSTLLHKQYSPLKCHITFWSHDLEHLRVKQTNTSICVTYFVTDNTVLYNTSAHYKSPDLPNSSASSYWQKETGGELEKPDLEDRCLGRER